MYAGEFVEMGTTEQIIFDAPPALHQGADGLDAQRRARAARPRSRSPSRARRPTWRCQSRGAASPSVVPACGRDCKSNRARASASSKNREVRCHYAEMRPTSSKRGTSSCTFGHGKKLVHRRRQCHFQDQRSRHRLSGRAVGLRQDRARQDASAAREADQRRAALQRQAHRRRARSARPLAPGAGGLSRPVLGLQSVFHHPRAAQELVHASSKRSRATPRWRSASIRRSSR